MTTGTEPHLLAMALIMAVIVFALSVLGTRIDQAWYRARLSGNEKSCRQWTAHLADAAFDGLLIHRGGTILQMNRALVRMLGCRERECIGQSFANFAAPRQMTQLRAELEAPAPAIMEFTLIRADKSELLVEISSQSIDHEGLPASVTAIRDITQRRADAERISWLSRYDPLTGLVNRASFTDKLIAALARNDAQGGTTAVFSIDLDEFKSVNEQIGRGGGDQLLQQVAARIDGLITGEDTLGRLGGDKFGLIMPSLGAANRAINIAAQLEATFKDAFIIDNKLVRASLSIGIAIFPDHATDPEGLLKASDFALKQAIRVGGGCTHVFSHEEAQSSRAGSRATERARGRDLIRVGLSEPQRLSQDLRAAIAKEEISLVYQPVFRTGDLSLAGFEALARWNHKQDGLIPPNVFIPLAEQAGLIHEIGSFVLETACAEAASIGGDCRMAVNLSPLQFRDPNLPGRISAILRKTGLAAARLELEVTESVLIDNKAAAAQALRSLRAIGCSVALDDFGTGYSSLSYLCDFPFARLKIDKHFIQALGTDPNADAVVTAILALAKNLKLEVTAEGVETEAQLAFLRQTECQLLQGFLLGKPVARAQHQMLPVARGLPLVSGPTLVATRA
jgi:diguanylate cyclase (GGDEF)-like protein/PAS domain S-box-containing protein